MEEGGKLTTETDVKETKQVLLKVTDTGRGMTPEVVKRLFVPFFTLKKNGTGLGLVLCKQIAESFGGELTIDSIGGKGTLVTVRIPMAKNE
jgi:two-component system, sporulation sensor kinase D